MTQVQTTGQAYVVRDQGGGPTGMVPVPLQGGVVGIPVPVADVTPGPVVVFTDGSSAQAAPNGMAVTHDPNVSVQEILPKDEYLSKMLDRTETPPAPEPEIPSYEFYIGMDPDMHDTAVAIVDGDGVPAALFMIQTKYVKGRVDYIAVLDMIDAVTSALSSSQLPGPTMVKGVAVEGQEVTYTVKSGKNPKDILNLAPISGALLAMSLIRWGEGARIEFMAPKDWKGQVPKQAHQARLYAALGWEYAKSGNPETGYCYPLQPPGSILGIEKLGDGKEIWKHLGDAIALARWVRDVCKRETRKEETVADLKAKGVIAEAPAKKKAAKKTSKKTGKK